MSSEEIILNITPDVSLLAKLGRSNFTISYALGEFIDNAYDARGNITPIKVNIDFNINHQAITITDDGLGMDNHELETALKVGLSSKRNDSIGQYGLGLKAAATFLAKRFTIETVKLDSATGLRVIYDQKQFEAIGKWELRAEIIPQPEGLKHGTRIILSDLNIDIQKVDTNKIKSNFSRIYHKLIESKKLFIFVNDEPLEPLFYELMPGLKWEIDLVVNGKKVKGWVGAMIPKGRKVDTEAGFELIRFGRVLKYGEWIGINRHAAVRTLIGELELDLFEVNNNKTDFLRDTPEWLELVEVMKNFFANNNIRQKIHKGTTGVKDITKKLALKRDITNIEIKTGITSVSTVGEEPELQPIPLPHKQQTPSYVTTSSTENLTHLNDPLKNKRTINVFVVHGTNQEHLKECVNLIKSFNLNPIVLQEQPNQGRTIIEKFEAASRDCQYAVILLTPDDMAYCPLKKETLENMRPRARQNVIFEFGYFVGKLSRKKTACLYKDSCNLELPTDLAGVAYIPFKENVEEAKEELKREFVKVGFLK